MSVSQGVDAIEVQRVFYCLLRSFSLSPFTLSANILKLFFWKSTHSLQWTDWSSIWEEHYEHTTLPVTHTLLSFLQLSKATSILEVACGTGAGARLCNFLKPKNAQLSAVDFALAMVALTRNKIDDPSVIVLEASAECLPFKDGSFDRLYSSYCLHLVPDPDLVLKEAFRVLQPGSIAAFSIWGRKENSPRLTYLNELAEKIGVSLFPNLGPPPTRSPFYLGQDPEALRQRALAAGFSKAVAFYQANPHPSVDPETVTTTIFAAPTPAKAVLTEQQRQELRRESVQYIQQLVEKGQPLGFETLVLVLVK